MGYLHGKTVKIRKDRRCFACGRLFQKGTKMHSSTCTDSGSIFTTHTCETCNTIMVSFGNEFDDGYGEFDHLFVANSLNKDQTPEELLAELMRQRELESVERWQRRFNEPWTKYPIT